MSKTWQEELRKRLEPLNGAALARRLGVDSSTIHRYKTGKRVPSPGMLARICQDMGWSADELLGLSREAPTRDELMAIIGHLQEALDTLGPYAQNTPVRMVSEPDPEYDD